MQIISKIMYSLIRILSMAYHNPYLSLTSQLHISIPQNVQIFAIVIIENKNIHVHCSFLQFYTQS